MSRRRSFLRFPAIFLVSLSVLLAFVLVTELLIAREGELGGGLLSALQACFVASIYFLIMSGYLVVFLVSYFAFTRRIEPRPRLFLNVTLFLVSYVFFIVIFGNSFSELEWQLLVAGAIAAAISDLVAEAFETAERVSL